MKQTAMQYLKQDLQETFNTANDALLAIENEEIRLACQEVVKVTIKNIIDRIDEKLLEMEKEQIIDAWKTGDTNGGIGILATSDEYYNETF